MVSPPAGIGVPALSTGVVSTVRRAPAQLATREVEQRCVRLRRGARVGDERVEARPSEIRLGQVHAALEELRDREVVADIGVQRLGRGEPRRRDRHPVRCSAGLIVRIDQRVAAIDAACDRVLSQLAGRVVAVPAVDVDRADGSASREFGHDQQVAVRVLSHEVDGAAERRACNGLLEEPEADVSGTGVGVPLQGEVEELVPGHWIGVLRRVRVHHVDLAVHVVVEVALPVRDRQRVLAPGRERGRVARDEMVPVFRKSLSKDDASKPAGNGSSFPFASNRLSQSTVCVTPPTVVVVLASTSPSSWNASPCTACAPATNNRATRCDEHMGTSRNRRLRRLPVGPRTRSAMELPLSVERFSTSL